MKTAEQNQMTNISYLKSFKNNPTSTNMTVFASKSNHVLKEKYPYVRAVATERSWSLTHHYTL